ncbi:MAG: MBL fold metallo-hydrolase [Deltaproteobacteria bacterium]|nr:MBL fold metallo-hydrolase [Deltaproteobacteria bacterium]MBW2020851.1 MBL fold metallo-hydrolase [Deltaproteobacteria bacterium]MBW2075290.1 MBL fold metallo-hydrolase [Deltaproteobacteria bacterium]RLB82023.1 MAG: MBL fold metallo-hydrolase [Deltaproteobacteria bacterium]
MKITLVYDNTAHKPDLVADWGFSCYIELENTPGILFDTGANGSILLSNMEKLGIDPAAVDIVVISHAHWDHTGGLLKFLKVNDTARLYLPASFHSPPLPGRQVVEVRGSIEVCDNIFSTGELMGTEQSLVVQTDKGLVVIAGCSHPGVGPILKAASRFGTVRALIGGLHGFQEFHLLKDLQWVCACHCTQHQSEIKEFYPEKWVDGGAGKVIEV